MSMTDEQIVKALECCIENMRCDECPLKCTSICVFQLYTCALDLIKRQQADKERLEIELQTMRIAANSYKSRVQTLEMDNAQLHSDIVNANQNFDHINGLWEAEKEKVEKAKQKVINICKELQKAKAEIEEQDKAILNALKRMGEVRAEAVREFAKKLEGFAILCEFDNGNGKPYFEEVVKFFDIERIKEEMTEKEGGKK